MHLLLGDTDDAYAIVTERFRDKWPALAQCPWMSDTYAQYIAPVEPARVFYTVPLLLCTKHFYQPRVVCGLLAQNVSREAMKLVLEVPGDAITLPVLMVNTWVEEDSVPLADDPSVVMADFVEALGPDGDRLRQLVFVALLNATDRPLQRSVYTQVIHRALAELYDRGYRGPFLRLAHRDYRAYLQNHTPPEQRHELDVVEQGPDAMRVVFFADVPRPRGGGEVDDEERRSAEATANRLEAINDGNAAVARRDCTFLLSWLASRRAVEDIAARFPPGIDRLVRDH
jgi:hypothetical protein